MGETSAGLLEVLSKVETHTTDITFLKESVRSLRTTNNILVWLVAGIFILTLIAVLTK